MALANPQSANKDVTNTKGMIKLLGTIEVLFILKLKIVFSSNLYPNRIINFFITN